MDLNNLIMPEVTPSAAHLSGLNSNQQNSAFLQLPDFSNLNQLTITKQHKNPLFNLFHTHQKEELQLIRFNDSANNLIDYSSDALLHYCRNNNFNAMKEIISFDSNNYNDSNSADTANNLQAIRNIKIDLEYVDEVFFHFNFFNFYHLCLIMQIIKQRPIKPRSL